MKRFFVIAFSLFFAVCASAQTPNGHLVIIGGGTRTPQIMNKFFDLAGGKDAKFLVITTAGHETPEIDGKKAVKEYAGYGVKDVKWIAPTRAQANDPEYVKAKLEGVDGVFFTGGLQRRIVDTLRGTEMHKQLMALYYEKGIVIGGTSAGAGMMTDPMIAGGKKPVNKSSDKDNRINSISPGNARITPGMGFLKNAIIDQHFIKRSRENRYFSAAFDHPEVTAFGIDEATAMVITDGREVEVIGEGSVMVTEVEPSAIKKDKNKNYGCSGMTVRILLNGDTYSIPQKDQMYKTFNFTANTTGQIDYYCQREPFKGRKVTIYFHIPEGDIENMPVQFVMHGDNRNGDGYRDAWIAKSDQYGFVDICPNFAKEIFDDEEYHRGNVAAADGSQNPSDAYVYNVIDEIFDYFVSHSGSNARTFNIYGHSAGGQFVHRFMTFRGGARIGKAVAANSGWYTMPNNKIEFPYGTKGYKYDKKAFYAAPMTILLGTADTLRTANLNQSAKADKQGMTRYARGNNYYEYCRKDAKKLGYEFNWKIEYVPGVGHSNKKMGPAAADIIYGK